MESESQFKNHRSNTFHKQLVCVNPRSARSVFLTSVFVEKIPCVWLVPFLRKQPNILENKVMVRCWLNEEIM